MENQEKKIEEILKAHEERTLYADSHGHEVTALERERVAGEINAILHPIGYEAGRAAAVQRVESALNGEVFSGSFLNKLRIALSNDPTGE